ncbi:hypothetical protein JVU11DRAFT_4100 [Chiua virens]|nr:hypothetical protein JVU11DRAFT_4100 [Chiua virens]
MLVIQLEGIITSGTTGVPMKPIPFRQVSIYSHLSLRKVQRINNSIATSPTFWFETPRLLTAYGETAFPLAFFASNQTENTILNVTIENARSFFQHKYPGGFYRRQAPYDVAEAVGIFTKIFDLIGVLPGHNEGVGNYVGEPSREWERTSSYAMDTEHKSIGQGQQNCTQNSKLRSEQIWSPTNNLSHLGAKSPAAAFISSV